VSRRQPPRTLVLAYTARTHVQLWSMEDAMGVKWTARLKVNFEMDEGISAHQAEVRLRVSAAEFQRLIEKGPGNVRSCVKPGSAKVDIVAQGQTAW
jgi:hypothetical protein